MSSNRRVSPAFTSKICAMLTSENKDIICWNEEGDGFIILDIKTFVSKLMPLYFKTKKFSSFVRQLNFYGFKKNMKEARSPNQSEFKHPKFRKFSSNESRRAPVQNTEIPEDPNSFIEVDRLIKENLLLKNIINMQTQAYNQLLGKYYAVVKPDYQTNNNLM